MRYSLLASSIASFLLLFAGAARAQERPDPDLAPGYRMVKQPADAKKGEKERQEIYDPAGKLSNVRIKYLDGHLRDEKYEDNGSLKSVYETDYKSWSTMWRYSGSTLVQVEHMAAGARPTVTYVNAEALPSEIVLAMGQQLRFFSSPKNLFVALADVTTDGGTNNVLKWSVRGVQPPAGAKDCGGYEPARQGAAEVHVQARGNKRDSLTVIVKDSSAPAGSWGRVTRSPLFGNPPNVPGQPVRNWAAVPGATIVARDAATGKEVARTKTDSEGNYLLALPPGKYVIAPVYPGPTPGGLPRAISSQVEVVKGSWDNEDLRFDTGIK